VSTAHGKVILLGEHAVVYGVPALAVGIDRGARAEAKPGDGTRSTLSVPAWRVTVSDVAHEEVPLAHALRDLIAASGVTGTFDIEAEADLPPGGGLGCSAALGVAVARAIDPAATPDVIADRVMAWERVFHGNPSGIDAAVASLGGCVFFQKGEPITRVRVGGGGLHLCIGHTGQASSTKAMVESVARIRERRPEIAQKTFDGITTLVKNARLAIEAGDRRALGQLLDLNQMLLSGLFLSTPEIEELCAAARAAGAHGAKLTGAGGGGCVVALVEDAARGEAVLAAWKRAGFEGFASTVGTGAAPRSTPHAQIQEAP
jgi:mevalonate kinase